MSEERELAGEVFSHCILTTVYEVGVILISCTSFRELNNLFRWVAEQVKVGM